MTVSGVHFPQHMTTAPSTSPLLRRLTKGAAIAVGLFLAGTASAQVDRIDHVWDKATSSPRTAEDELYRIDDDMAQQSSYRRSGLFRENSMVLSVEATMQRDATTGAWSATLMLDEQAGQLRRERTMRVMPGAFLEDVEQIIGSTPNQRVTFEITGETFVYSGRNYLLLRSPPRVASLERIADDAQARLEPDADAVPDRPTPRSQRTADDVMRDLQQDTGPMLRRPGHTGNGEAAPNGTVESTWREGTLLVARRGRVTRSAGGAWLFVFDADAQGLADPPLTLLPCLLLERIERFSRRVGPTQPVQLSGQVFVYEGRGYLLPSAFHVPRERTPLH